MLASLALALAMVVGAGAPGTTPIVSPHPVHHACTLTRCGGHCPKGEWRCNGKCIPKNQACRLVP